MNITDAIKNRYSAKNFDSNYHIDSETQKKLLDLCLSSSPSAFNLQHWRLVLVEDKEQRSKIREIAWNQSQVTDSSMLVIITADLNSWVKSPERVWEESPAEVKKFMVDAIYQYYNNKPAVQRDEVMRSAGIFSQTLMLAAQEFGLDSCPMDGFDFDKMAEIIKLPDDHVICLMIAIGKNTQPRHPKIGKLSFNEVVKTNCF